MNKTSSATYTLSLRLGAALLILVSLLAVFNTALAGDPPKAVSSTGDYAWGLGAKPARNRSGVADAPKVSPGKLAVAAGAANSLPTKVDYTALVPPVGNQGGQSSCVGWAVGYYYKTIQEYRERGWSLGSPTSQFSPSFVYNQINEGVDAGAWPADAFDLLKNTGDVSLADFPYNVSDYLKQPAASLKSAANPYKAKSWAYLFYNPNWPPGKVPNPANTVDILRQYLASGDVFNLTIPIYNTWDYVGNTPTSVVTTPPNTSSYRGDHEITVIGYDDSLTSSDGTGAFRVVNQWGTGWGDKGFSWLSYAFITKYAEDATAMTDLIDRANLTYSVAKSNTAALNYSGQSWLSQADSSSLSGTLATSYTSGDYVDFPFYGNSIAWVGPFSQQAGVADVYLDGIFQQRVDQWREGKTSPRNLIYYRGDLPLGNHILRLVARGPVIEHCPGNWSCSPLPARGPTLVDALVVNPDYVDNTSSEIIYAFYWEHLNDATSLNVSESRSNINGSYFSYNFTGTNVAWIGTTRPNAGRADVYLDGKLVSSVELYSPAINHNQTLFSQSNLNLGSHTLQVIVRPDRHNSATDNYVSLDYLVVNTF